jgi:hypothetical protein
LLQFPFEAGQVFCPSAASGSQSAPEGSDRLERKPRQPKRKRKLLPQLDRITGEGPHAFQTPQNDMKRKSQTTSRPVLMALIATVILVAGKGVSADPLSGGADPNLQNRIEQTAPSASDRLLNRLRENPPSAAAKKSLRPRSSRHQHDNPSAHAR